MEGMVAVRKIIYAVVKQYPTTLLLGIRPSDLTVAVFVPFGC
jgi:hypothetical protein